MNHENVFSVFGLQLIYIRAALLNGRLWANFERKLFKCLCVRLNGNFGSPSVLLSHLFLFAFFFLLHLLLLFFFLSVFFLYFLKPLMHFRSAYLPIWILSCFVPFNETDGKRELTNFKIGKTKKIYEYFEYL